MKNGMNRMLYAGDGFRVELQNYSLVDLEDIHEVYPFPRLAVGRNLSDK
jgi:hypothetical protein